MPHYINITDVADELFRNHSWYHAFIRELYFTSAHCVVEITDEQSTRLGESFAPLHIRLTIAFIDSSKESGIEMLFWNVSGFSLQRIDELAFLFTKHASDDYTVDFSNPDIVDGECYIRAKKIDVCFLGESYFGPWLRIGHELPTLDAPEAATLEGIWRQCPVCHGAWQESPKIEFSRCPDCGTVSRKAFAHDV